MFDTASCQHAFFSFLESEQALLFISEASDLKRTYFLNELVDAMDEHKKTVYFRLNAEVDLAHLVEQMTDRFFIPVRSVNVSLLKQLQEQLDILRQMKQRVVLLIEDAHQLSQKNLLILLELAAHQKRFASMSIVLFGKPSLGKRLAQSGKFSEDLSFEVLSLLMEEPLEEEKQKSIVSHQGAIAWMIEKRVRLISLAALFLVSFLLWKFEGGGKQFGVAPQIASEAQKKTPESLKEIPELKAKQAMRSEFKDFLFYLKSIERQVGYHWNVKLKEDHLQFNQERMPALPLPVPIKSAPDDE